MSGLSGLSGLSATEVAQLRADAPAGWSDRCTIVRPANSHGWDGDDTETAVVTDQVCAYHERVSREVRETGGVRLVTTAVLCLPFGADVQEGDRVTSVTDATGAERLARDRGIDGIARTSSHVEVVLSGSGV